MKLDVEVECQYPEYTPSVRMATLLIGGIPIFTEQVYDTDAEGNRTDKQAVDNLLRHFSYRLNQVIQFDE